MTQMCGGESKSGYDGVEARGKGGAGERKERLKSSTKPEGRERRSSTAAVQARERTSEEVAERSLIECVDAVCLGSLR